jgi:hypothetical protein
MSVTRGVAVAAISAGMALAAASTAWADPPTMSGAYDVNTAAGNWGTVQFTPCGAGCSHAQDPNDPSISGQARLSNGQWTLVFVNDPIAIVCPDKSSHPGDQHLVWDANTLQGQLWTTAASDPCPNPQPGPLSIPAESISLSKE